MPVEFILRCAADLTTPEAVLSAFINDLCQPKDTSLTPTLARLYYLHAMLKP